MRLISNRFAREAERGDADEVVAFVAGEGDRDSVRLLSVRAVRETLPVSDVTVTVARSIGRLSGPVMRPRMTSLV